MRLHKVVDRGTIILPPLEESVMVLFSKDLAILSCSDVVVALLIMAGMEEHESEELAGREREEERRGEKRETEHCTPN